MLETQKKIGLRLLREMFGGGLSLQVGLARRWSKLRQNGLIPAFECTITGEIGSEIDGGGYIYIYISLSVKHSIVLTQLESENCHKNWLSGQKMTKLSKRQSP